MDPSDAQLRWAFLVGEEGEEEKVGEEGEEENGREKIELDENEDCLRPAEVAASRLCGSTGT